MLMNYWPSNHGTHFTLALLVCDVVEAIEARDEAGNSLMNVRKAEAIISDAKMVDALRGTMGIPSVLD